MTKRRTTSEELGGAGNQRQGRIINKTLPSSDSKVTYNDMPGGRLNPLSVTNIMEQFGNAVNKAKDKKHEKTSSLRQKMGELGLTTSYVDLSIKVNEMQWAPGLAY